VVILILSGIFVLTFVWLWTLNRINKRRSRSLSRSPSLPEPSSPNPGLLKSARETQFSTALHDFRPHQEQYPLASFASPIPPSPTPCYPTLSPPLPAYTPLRTLRRPLPPSVIVSSPRTLAYGPAPLPLTPAQEAAAAWTAPSAFETRRRSELGGGGGDGDGDGEVLTFPQRAARLSVHVAQQLQQRWEARSLSPPASLHEGDGSAVTDRRFPSFI
jgi:hypothetical protein